MGPKNFVVVGAARSGLGRTARLLSGLGAECGHERVFHPVGFRAGPTLHWSTECPGEASWFAAPVLGKLPESIVVVRQVRDPLAVVSELYGSGFFERNDEDRWFAEDFLGDEAGAPPLERAMLHWLRWNQLIEDTLQVTPLEGHRVFAESLTRPVDPSAVGASRGAGVLARITRAIGVARHRSICAKALERLGAPEEPEFAPRRLDWDDLPAGRTLDEMRALAAQYGYGVESRRRRLTA